MRARSVMVEIVRRLFFVCELLLLYTVPTTLFLKDRPVLLFLSYAPCLRPLVKRSHATIDNFGERQLRPMHVLMARW